MPQQDEHYTGRMKLSISYAVFCLKKKKKVVTFRTFRQAPPAAKISFGGLCSAISAYGWQGGLMKTAFVLIRIKAYCFAASIWMSMRTFLVIPALTR